MTESQNLTQLQKQLTHTVEWELKYNCKHAEVIRGQKSVMVTGQDGHTC